MYTPLSHECTIQSHDNMPSLNAYATLKFYSSKIQDLEFYSSKIQDLRFYSSKIQDLEFYSRSRIVLPAPESKIRDLVLSSQRLGGQYKILYCPPRCWVDNIDEA